MYDKLLEHLAKVTRLLHLAVSGHIATRKAMKEQIETLSKKMDAQNAAILARLDLVSDTQIQTHQAVKRLTPMIEAAVEFLREHPDFIDMPSRHVSDREDVEYSHMTIYRAQQAIKEQIQQ